METGGVKRRGEAVAALNGNGGSKKSKREMESFTTGIGSKLKPCTKFFSSSGCPFGDGCHFLHYVPGGIKAVTQILGSNPALPAARHPAVPSSFPDRSSPTALKTRLCTKFNTAEGCKFGDKCHYAHGEWELGRPARPSHEDSHAIGQMPGRYSSGHFEQNEPNLFGASATAKISIDASLVGAVIGKGGMNSKQICRVTGAKLAIRDHESDPNSKNIELEGSFDQIKNASQMVRELIVNVSSGLGRLTKNRATAGLATGGNFKTKLCDNFTKGSCTFGEKCHFAHGEEELRRFGV